MKDNKHDNWIRGADQASLIQFAFNFVGLCTVLLAILLTAIFCDLKKETDNPVEDRIYIFMK